MGSQTMNITGFPNHEYPWFMCSEPFMGCWIFMAWETMIMHGLGNHGYSWLRTPLMFMV
jgi:hypothetical protein